MPLISYNLECRCRTALICHGPANKLGMLVRAESRTGTEPVIIPASPQVVVHIEVKDPHGKRVEIEANVGF